MKGSDVREELARIRTGGDARQHEKAQAQGKMFCRDRLARLLDEGSFVEDAAFANAMEAGLPADGVVTGSGRIDGRTVCVMANDFTVKAGSWGKRTVEKILRVQEQAERLECPLIYLVDSAGARITDQLEMFPGRRGAGRIFHNQVRFNGRIPQVCLLFGPSTAGGAYIPALCDVVFMVEGNASMALGSPRMAAEVIGQDVSLDDRGGAKMHCKTSGCGDLLATTEEEALDATRAYLSYLPGSFDEALPEVAAVPPAQSCGDLEGLLPENENKPFDMRLVIERLIDADSWFEIKKLFAGEVLTGFARIDGRPIGIVANQSKVKGGVLFSDSADKAARFIELCNGYGLPLLYLADVPGFMIGKQVEREGIIRSGAKMITAMSAATVPRISVIVRKAYGAGLYAMCGPAFEPDACLALPSAMIAVMGPEAAVNAVYFNKLQAIEDEDERAAEVERLRAEYREDVDIRRLASELVIDAIVDPADLRDEIATRFAVAEDRRDTAPPRHTRIHPM